MKKFQNLGKELPKISMKKIIGGNVETEIGSPCNCNSKEDCTDAAKPTCYNGAAYECVAGTKTGWCEK